MYLADRKTYRIQAFHKQLVKYETSRRMARAVSDINAPDSKELKMNLSGIVRLHRVPRIPGRLYLGTLESGVFALQQLLLAL
jgi:hypothetical protein